MNLMEFHSQSTTVDYEMAEDYDTNHHCSQKYLHEKTKQNAQVSRGCNNKKDRSNIHLDPLNHIAQSHFLDMYMAGQRHGALN